VPFALFYLLEQGGQKARLVGSSRLSGDAASSVLADLNSPEPDGEWPLGEVARTGRSVRVDGLAPRLRALSAQAGLSPTDAALVLPVGLPGSTRLSGLLVVGLSSRLVLDEKYLSFLELLAGHVATAVASTRALQEARERADALAELDRAKTDFFSNVSHEFRTPLTLMLGPIEDGLADQDQPLPPAQRERQELVRRNGLRLQKLVNTLLDFARIEAGRAQAAFVPTDLAALTVDLASSFDSAMTSGGVKLIVDCPPLPEAVYVDPAMWEKVILNLLSNALKFTFTGEIRLALKWLGDRVELSVQDTGTGIPVEELPRVFERFHRVEGARGRSHEGTGIGLALVEELVKLHGGGVAVKSALGKGSTFTVSLPTGSAHLPQQLLGTGARTLTSTGIGPGAFLAEVSQWDATSAPPRSTPAPVNAAPSALQAGARILLADDNADMRTYVRRLLSAEGFDVEAVGDGEAALDAARRRQPDLILSDVMMPRLDGFGLLAALRADAAVAETPFILLSARAGEEARVEGLEAGADDYLTKPFAARELIARVSANLNLARDRREAALRALAIDLEQRVLEHSRERGLMWHTSPELFSVIDLRKGRFETVNPAWTATLGWRGDEIEGVPYTDFVHPDDIDASIAAFEQARKGDPVLRFENRYRHKDGEWRWLSWVAVPEGAMLYSTTRDITEAKARDAQLVQAQEALRQSQRWRRSANSPAASPTTSTTCWRAYPAAWSCSKNGWARAGSTRSAGISTPPGDRRTGRRL
jgi:PAS domain S-box-containing protein